MEEDSEEAITKTNLLVSWFKIQRNPSMAGYQHCMAAIIAGAADNSSLRMQPPISV